MDSTELMMYVAANEAHKRRMQDPNAAKPSGFAARHPVASLLAVVVTLAAAITLALLFLV